MERSHIPLRKWLKAIHFMVSSKKGFSALQLSRVIDVTCEAAWFIMHRIRECMKVEPLASMLDGIVEVDETYIGGKPRHKGDNKRGRGTKKKPVMVLVQRDGSARAKPIDRVDAKTLKNEIAVNVTRNSSIMTDDFVSYEGLDSNYASHKTVNHSAGEYVRREKKGPPIHTNTAESFFALLKRGHYGVYHSMSKKHLHRYCNEFSFRWCFRQSQGFDDEKRMNELLKRVAGRRLMYKAPKGESLVK
jgi:transposase-like protein